MVGRAVRLTMLKNVLYNLMFPYSNEFETLV